MRELPHATVACVVEREGKFLLVRERREGRVVYNQPAGHIEQGESITQAALRETLEETGWHISLSGCLGVYVYHAPNGITYIRTTLYGNALQHNPARPLDEGIEAAEWFTYEEICNLGEQLRSPLVLRVIEDFLSGKCYPLAMLTEDA